MSHISKAIEAVQGRINELSGDEPGLKFSYEQIKQLVAAFSVDEDLRMTFNMLVMRGTAARTEHDSTIGVRGKDEEH